MPAVETRDGQDHQRQQHRRRHDNKNQRELHVDPEAGHKTDGFLETGPVPGLLNPGWNRRPGAPGEPGLRTGTGSGTGTVAPIFITRFQSCQSETSSHSDPAAGESHIKHSQLSSGGRTAARANHN